MSIEVRNISKSFGGFQALKDVNLVIPAGELVVLLGPSGSGKTTLLRVIAGLERPTSEGGSILFNGQDVAAQPVQHRQVGFVFQHYALFRHMTVFENVAFGLRVKPRQSRPAPEQIEKKVNEVLRLVQVESMAGRYPNQLSGGQRQRVALARALAVEPSVLLLDEPFGALDARVRKELRVWLRRLHDEIHVTSIMVTHDQEEALEVADRVVVMNEGRIEQVGTPDDVFHRPVSPFVMAFLGQVNFFHGREAAQILVRPHDLEVLAAPDNANAISARIARAQSAGPSVRLDLVAGDGRVLYAEMSHREYQELGVTLNTTVFVRPRHAKVFMDYQI